MTSHQTGNSRGPCRTCRGEKTIKVQAHKDGKPAEIKVVACPACRGSGAAGYLTKTG